MGNAPSAENHDNEGEGGNGPQAPNGVPIDEALAGGALIGAAAGLLYWALSGDSSDKSKQQEVKKKDHRKPSPVQPISSVREKKFTRPNGQVVTAVYIDCESQRQAFLAAMSRDKQKRLPLLHHPHGEDVDRDPGCWHYHPASHDVWENNCLMDYHYMFLGNDEQVILALDRSKREE